MTRSFERNSQQMRPIKIEIGVNRYAEGAVIINFGHTRVLCTCTVEGGVPPFQLEKGEGWATAEYAMLPRSTHTRSRRDRKGSIGGRTMEIQRLIGRSLRSVLDLSALQGFTLTIDCDVLQADGGTRTASITGAFVAMAIACKALYNSGKISRNPIKDNVAAVSLGILADKVNLDLDYEEDFAADVDLNLVMTGAGQIVEVQGTAEGEAFTREQLNQMLELGSEGIQRLSKLQNQVIETISDSTKVANFEIDY
tara:strand:- start:86 stop:844 length:759 start_codon:yes stop_codon:yes gene_type:complete